MMKTKASVKNWREYSEYQDDVIELIRNLPEDATLEDIIDELYGYAKIESGIIQLDAAARYLEFLMDQYRKKTMD